MGEDGRVTATSTDERPAQAADSVLAEAVDLARRAVEQEAAAHVGEYRGCVAILADGPQEAGTGGEASAPVAVHLFDCTAPAYAGWRWSVAVTRLDDDPRVTIDEVVLQPGEGALLPPPWVPWSQRLLAGDLGVGDLLPTGPEDERLVPAYAATGDPVLDEVALELGLGRVRVMSRLGRTDAAERWHEGPTGPDSPMARQAPGQCGTCAFYLPLEGSLRTMLGACGNEYAPSDGRIVDALYGCGAHSEAVSEPEPEPLTAVSYDTQRYDVLDADVEPVDLTEDGAVADVTSDGAAADVTEDSEPET
ncbi:MAG: DUF3027 domain-containing protein [Geodermatophilaceae bacterium]|nr:DUF3027 domain-containing protein [Geodermatophilaceae bacterium]